MATLAARRPATAGFSGLFIAFFAAVADWNDRRVTAKALYSLTDRELDDIGLNRGDVARLVR